MTFREISLQRSVNRIGMRQRPALQDGLRIGTDTAFTRQIVVSIYY